MKPSSDNLNSNQPKLLSKREDKKRVNIPCNHGLFFQIGLIVSLTAVFFVMESSIEYLGINVDPPREVYFEEPSTIIFDIEKPSVLIKPVQKVIVKQSPQNNSIASLINAIPDDSTVIETTIKGDDIPVIDDASKVVAVINPKVYNKSRNMNTVEFVPVFPGCEAYTSNEEKVACMSSKIGAFIQKKFRTDQFNNLDRNKIQKVYVQFKIDKNGDITNVKSRAMNSELETEGSRVIEKLPRMIPGRQGNVNVDVMYMVPILFKVE